MVSPKGETTVPRFPTWPPLHGKAVMTRSRLNPGVMSRASDNERGEGHSNPVLTLLDR